MQGLVVPLKSELLLRIKDAEAAADAKVAETETQAAEVARDGRRAAEKALADGKAKADSAYQATVSAARDEAAEEAKKLLANGKRQATAARKRFESGLDGVDDRVLKLFSESL